MTRPAPPAAKYVAELKAAQAALARKDLTTAERIANGVLTTKANDANAHQVLGCVALERDNLLAAKDHLLAAMRGAPNHPPLLNTLGIVLRRMGELPQARTLFQRAGEAGLIEAWRNLGRLEELDGQLKASVIAYRKALSLRPDDPESNASMARLCERLNDLDSAKIYAQAALRADPGNDLARLSLAQILLRMGDAEAALNAASTTAQGASSKNRAIAWGLIGDGRESLQDFDGAFEAYTNANAALIEQHQLILDTQGDPFHPQGIAAIMRIIDETARTTKQAPAAGQQTTFLIGFPRSGTTLLDQILSSHPEVVCIEEQPYFADTVVDAGVSFLTPSQLLELPEATLEKARIAYLKKLTGDVNGRAKIVIDKLPLNIVMLPFIHRLFPDARIILALRDPRDVLLSCFTQRFEINVAMAQFLRLETAAAYYRDVMGLLEECRAKLPLNIVEVRYEDVVADLEETARRLTKFLGVEYAPGMLEFNKTARKRLISTPSARQVVKPLYNSSIGRWRSYASHLEPTLPVIAPWVSLYGYTAS